MRMERMVHGLKAAFSLLRMLPKKNMMLVFLQVATSGAVFAFADVIEPILYAMLFDGLQDNELSSFLTSCALSAMILAVMLVIQYLNDVILDANLFHAINELSIRSFESYHRIPFYRTSELEDGDVYNRIQNGSDQAVSIWGSIIMALSNSLSAVFLLFLCVGISWTFVAIALGLSLTAILHMRIRMKQADAYSQRNEAVMSRLEGSRYSAVYDMEFSVVSGMEEHILTAYREQRERYWTEKKQNTRRESFVDAISETWEHLFRCIAPFALLAGRGGAVLTYGRVTSAFSVLDSLRESIPDLSERMAGVAKALVPIERLQDLLLPSAGSAETVGHIHIREPAVCVKDLWLCFGDRQVLRGLSLEISYGQKVALIGKNGSGKSTLLRSIMGYTKPDTGWVIVAGANAAELSHENKRTLFSYAPASPQLFSESVEENISMGADKSELMDILPSAGQACIAHDMLSANSDTLSGGQAMRANLARAFIHHAPILILDEPTSSVEAGMGREILQAALCRSSTLLVTTHDPAYLSQFDRLILMKDGQKLCDGPYEEVSGTHEYQEWASDTLQLKGEDQEYE